MAAALVLRPPLSLSAAPSSNFWRDISGVYGGSWSEGRHWAAGRGPAATNAFVFFTNDQSRAYTVRLGGPTTSGIIRVATDTLTFDLNGYSWRAPAVAAGDYSAERSSVSHWFGGATGETSMVTFSSSQAPRVMGGNELDLGSGAYASMRFGAGKGSRVHSTFIIDDSLGYPVKVILPWCNYLGTAQLIVRGPGSELRNPNQVFHGYAGMLRIENGGLLNINGAYGPTTFGVYGSMPSTAVVDNATMITSGSGAAVGWGHRGTVILTNRSRWLVSGEAGIIVGQNRVYTVDPYMGHVVVAGRSTLCCQGGIILCHHAHAGPALGKMEILGESRLVVSNGTIVVGSHPVRTYRMGGAVYTNVLTLQQSQIALGDATHDGVISNAGVFTASGAITGQGPGRFRLRNERLLEVGDGIATLSITNGELENVASGTLRFELGASSNDRFDIHGGTAAIGGTCEFAVVSFTPTGGMYQRWDFVRADRVSYAASDNLTALMDSFGLVDGDDYTFGVVNDHGIQALRLNILAPRGPLIVVW